MKQGFFYRRMVLPILNLLRQGITPEKIALSIAFGIALGVFPVIGATTLLCAAAAIAFRLNLPAIQLVNYVVYPLQIALLLPFIRLGEFLFRVRDPMPFSITQILQMISASIPDAVATLWTATMHAIAAWFLVGPLAVLFVYAILAPLLRRVAHLYAASREPSSSTEAAQ
jgi:uncharacterized protein (DUF2062 family)